MGLERTHREVIRLRAEYRQEPRAGALRLAQQLSWYSMELALAKQYDKSERAWAEAFDVARHVLDEGGPTQYERTELIRIGVGAARAMRMVGLEAEATAVVEETELQYAKLVATAEDPTMVLAIRGAILGVRAEACREHGDRAGEIDVLCESVLEMLAGSEASPQIIGSMLRDPLRHLHDLLTEDAAR
ncbi:hypothetical protein [Demequina capsici]|uniref:Uncharacterized protein n=1 Tax=Demequina capsici TaxID=3075620 RepID=A0AA96F434_9MICO|nr:hypothetical protein [Demequina sp. OYTSA14]WNM23538.1 hypothetical protein RN606_09175 [Demequina sp. OYTSA14]